MGERELPEGWEWKRLGDLIELKYGDGLKGDIRDSSGKIPVYGSNGIVGYHNKPLTTKSCLIIGRKGSIGEVHLSEGPCWPIDTTYFVEPTPNVDLKFIFYLLKTLRLNSLDRSTAIPGLNRNDVYSKIIPFPPLPIQRQIVAVLEQAEAVKRQRQEADAMTGALLQSVFYEMFGDPVKNEKGWELKKLNDLIKDKKSVSCGPFGSQLKIGEHTKKGVPVLGIDNVGVNKFVQAKPKFITQEKYEQLIAFKVKPDDVLISRTGTIARTCVLPENFGDAIIGPNLLRISLDQNKLLPIFLSVAFNYMPSMIEQILRVSPGATVAVLNTGNLRNINIIVPPLTLQQQFARVVKSVELIREQQMASGWQIEGLCEGLMQRAFAGELAAN